MELQFLMVLKAGGEELLKLVEDSATIALAAELLQVGQRTNGGSGALRSMCIGACEIGEIESFVNESEGDDCLKQRATLVEGHAPTVTFCTMLETQELSTARWVCLMHCLLDVPTAICIHRPRSA
eukprot:SAG31_NODE_1488_length_8104_cov_6.771585_4_plen_125_part_00